MPYVDIAYIHTGTRAGVADAMVGLGAKGIVIASVGAGAPNGLDKELEEIIKKAQRCGGAKLSCRRRPHRARQ
jgi:L-asparaginase/Glu-tRNA(Gln) amidotransferase subunit D